MQTLPSEESRRILDAMDIPVVVLREDFHDVTAVPEITTAESGLSQAVSELVEVLDKSAVAGGEAVGTEKKQTDDADKEASDRPVIRPDSTDATGEPKSLRFTLVSAVAADVLFACELPDWSGGLLEGRLTGLCSDLVRALSPSTDDVDWQYFHWPIAGIKDHGCEAATDALDAWLHRRWAETRSADPVIAFAVSEIDLSASFSDALILPPLDQLAVSGDAKRSAWKVIQEHKRG
ncbi:MAG: hypothetical protein VX064_01205 [Pseudomonadota bacterium]|nr:hypothetical protein [Pseudomonadota bacterium]